MAEEKKMHVVHIASGDIWAGAESQLYTLAKTLHLSDRIKVSVVLLNHGFLEQQLKKTGINVTVFDETRLNGLRILLDLFSCLRSLKPDIVHTHGKKENILGSICLALLRDIISLRTAHGAPEHRPSPLQLHKWIYNISDWFSGRFLQHRIIAVSDDLKQKLTGYFPENSLTVIPNGLDIADINSHLPEKKYRSLSDNYTFRIGIAGRLVPVKRVDLFIRIAKEFVTAHPDISISFYIFGTGPMKDNLESLREQSGAKEHIHFEGHTDSMPAQLGRLDILIMVSDHEGLPMILLEAMACRTAIISHAVGGIPTLLDNGKCGILIDDQNHAKYVDAILKLIKNPSVRQDLSNNAFDQLTKHYSSKSNAEAYIKVYSSLKK